MSSVLLLTRGSAIAVDVVVVILTWIKTFGHWRHMRQLHINVSVTDILIRDGMIILFYFILLNGIHVLVVRCFLGCCSRHSVFPVSHFLPSLLSYYVNTLIL